MHLLFRSFLCSLLVSTAFADNQTANFSPINLKSTLPYAVTLSVYDMNAATVPTLQTYARGQIGDEWVLIGGRTNGLHDFTNDGLINFPPSDQNRTVWVINPVTLETWSRSLTDVSSGLTIAQIDSLSTTASQSAQQGDTLYMIGGYGYDTGLANFQTYPTLTALDLPGVIAWVKDGGPGFVNSFRQLSDEYLRVTGGELFLLGGRAQLVFGQNFIGGYTPGTNGDYTRQVRTFNLNDNGTTLSISLPAAESPQPEYRRRDLNVVPIMQGSASAGYDTGLAALSGVFTPSFGIWTVPVEITANGATTTGNSLDAATFRQGMNSYRSATISLYSPTLDQTHNVLLGGISVLYYDTATGTIEADQQIPFINGITSLVRTNSGAYSQTYLGEYPTIPNPSNNGAPFLFGAEADFFPLPGIANFNNGVLNLDSITTPTVIGYIFGGIIAERPNNGPTAASNYVFAVTLTPIPTPAFRVFGNNQLKTSTASRVVRGEASGSATAIQWRLNGNDWRQVTVNGSGKWQVNARNLRSGRNTLRLRAVNFRGDVTATQRRIILRN